MITIEISRLNKKKIKIEKLISLLPKNAYFHFFYEPNIIIRVKNKDKKYIADYLEKKKINYRSYRYPNPSYGFGDKKESMTYIYRDEFIPILNLTSKLALKAKKKDKVWILERYVHTFINQLHYGWYGEASLLNWLFASRINTIKFYYGDGAIISLLALIILWNTRVNNILIKWIQ